MNQKTKNILNVVIPLAIISGIGLYLLKPKHHTSPSAKSDKKDGDQQGPAHLLRDQSQHEKRVEVPMKPAKISMDTANKWAAQIRTGDSKQLERNNDIQIKLSKAGYKAIKAPNCLGRNCPFIAVRIDINSNVKEVVHLNKVGAVKLANKIFNGKLSSVQAKKAVIALEANDFVIKDGKVLKVGPRTVQPRQGFSNIVAPYPPIPKDDPYWDGYGVTWIH